MFLTVSLSSAQIATLGLKSSANLLPTGNSTPGVPVVAFGLAGVDFSMSVTPTIIRPHPFRLDSVTVFLSSLNGFSGVITLSVLGKIRTFGVNSVILGTGASTSANITFLDDAVPAGVFTEVILGRSTGIVHSASVTLISRPSVICIAPDGSSSCDETPSLITGPSTPSSQLRVAVVVDGSARQTFNGFDITLLSNHTILKPAGFDLSGSILPNPRPVTEDCIGGLSKNGIRCAPTDNTDTIHIATVGDLTQSLPGRLFTAIYNVTGSAYDAAIRFQTGCTAPNFDTSVPPDVCVAIGNGSVNSVPESVQSAGFSNLPFFGLSASPSRFSIQQGSSDFSTLTLSSLNNFNGNVTVSAKLSSSGPVADVSPASLLLTPDFPTNLSFLTLTAGKATPPGNYSITVSATNGTLSQSVTLTLTVPTPVFVITIFTNGSTVNAGDITTSFVVLASVTGFSGTISLALISSQGLEATLNPTSFTLSVGEAVESTLVATPMAQGILQANITATSGRLVHSATILLDVAGFSLFSYYYSGLTLLQGTTREVPVIVDSFPSAGMIAFKGNVTLTESVAPNIGLSVTCGPRSLSFNQTSPRAFEVTCSLLSSKEGNYTVTVTGTSRYLSSSLRLQVFGVQSQPVLLQLHSKHHLSLSKSANTAMFVTGLYNPNKSATLFAIVKIEVFKPMDPGYEIFADSQVIKVPPLTAQLNISLSVRLRPLVTGQFIFNVEIEWSSGDFFNAGFLIGNTVAPGVSNTGTFTVVP